jgi:quercetin dioxygenase-like cupin family protein
MKYQLKKLEELNWEPHPFLKGVEFKYLLTKSKDQIDITFVLARVLKGTDVPAHIHETQDDIIYCLAGEMKIWIEGEGNFDLKAGSMIRILKGVKHKPYGHSEDCSCIDIFLPAMV